MDSGIISYEQATGAPPLPDVLAGGDADSLPALTVTRAPAQPKPVPVAASPVAAAAPASAPPSAGAGAPGLISYEDATGASDSPHPGGALSNTADDTTASGAGKAIGTTIIKGLSHVPGMFGDAMDFGDYLIARGVAKVTGRPVEDILKENAAATKAGGWSDPRNFLPSGPDISDPVLAKTGEYKPTSEPGKLAMAAGETALGGVVGGGGITHLATNALAGGLGQGVTDVTQDPLLGAVAGIGAGPAARGGVKAVQKVVAPAIMGIPGIDRAPIIGPAVSAARDQAAGTQLLSQATDPNAAISWAKAPVEPSLTPDAPQTTAGAIGNDRGLFQAEKDARNANNLPFNAVDKAQSDAHQAAIAGAQPEGDVFRPGQVIRGRLDQIDQAVDAAHQRLAQQFADAHDQATQAATDGSAPLQQLPTPDQTGAAIRTAQGEATAAAKEARDALYRAVDPDGTLATVVGPLKQAKDAIAGAIDPHVGVQPTGAEAKLWSDIDRLPDVVPFKSLQTLDSRVTAAMTDARRNPNPEDPQAISRLTALKSATMDAIHNGVENQAAHEARLTQAGVMSPDAAMEARVAQWRNDHFAGQQEARMAGNSGRAEAGPRVGSAGSSRSFRTAGQAGEGFGGASGDQGLSPALQPNFDAEASQRLVDAKASHADYAQTYKNPTVAPVLADNGYKGQYTLPNGAIPSKAIVPGDKGYETAHAFLAAANRDPRAVTAMQDAALAPLRKNLPPFTNLNPNALARWKDTYSGAIRALDEVAPGFSSRFDNAANATQAVLDLGVRQKEAMDAFQARAAAAALERQASPAGKLAAAVGNSVAPAEVENAVGNMVKTGTGGATRMRSLVQSISSDPDAVAGLRKAGVDWMLRSFANADGSLSGAKFISFVRGNKDTLKELYPTSQVSMFGAIADRIEADARWRTETAIKGGSDTAKNVKPMLEKAVADTKQHLSIMGAATAGFLAGGPKGAAGGASLFLLNTLRSAGIKSINDLHHEALANPEVGRFLLSKMPAVVEGGKLRALAGALRKSLVVGAVQTQQAPRSAP